MGLLKTIVVLSSTTIVVLMAHLVLFGCFYTEFIFTLDGVMFKKTAVRVGYEHQRRECWTGPERFRSGGGGFDY